MIQSYDDSQYENLLGDLADMAESAQNRNIQPADPLEFIKWVQETTRNQSAALDSLDEKYKSLSQAEDLATIGLKRLESIILAPQRQQLETTQHLHRKFTRANGGIKHTLTQCRQTVRELITNYQMVSESLLDPLADRFKKIGIQKDLGLRLRDLDDCIKRCSDAVGAQDTQNKQLSVGIQDLMNKAGASLPPAVKEAITKEDDVRRIAAKLGKKIESGQDPINVTKVKIKPHELAVPLSKDTPKSEKALSGEDNAVSYTSAGISMLVGIIIGYLIISKFGKL